MAKKYEVCRLSELPPGERRFLTIERRAIGVLNVEGQLYALRNSCPHQGAPLCAGLISGTTVPGKPFELVYGRENEIIKCPWHGWEFEIATGRSVFNPHKVRVRSYDVTVEKEAPDPPLETYEVTVEDGLIFVHV